jgi:hypothetical protein
LDLKANFESGPSYFSFKSIDPGAFNVGFDRVNLHRLTRRHSHGMELDALAANWIGSSNAEYTML